MKLTSFSRLSKHWAVGPRAGRAARKRLQRPPLCLEQLEARLVPSLSPQLLKDINPNGASNPGQFV